jgi:hypothetical protein
MTNYFFVNATGNEISASSTADRTTPPPQPYHRARLPLSDGSFPSRMRPSAVKDKPPTSSVYSRLANYDFKHSPLDLQKRSIRLIKILPGYSQHDIRCVISHETIESTYTCLSYVWGEEDSGSFITLNGEDFRVRKNLYHFLQEACLKPRICSKALWIDALCIDQGNNGERTHQVQQMGQIFSSAERVISWLGPNQAIAQYLTGLPSRSYQRYEMRDDFNSCEYWSRAWITQEIALAKQVTFMAQNVERDEEVVESSRDRCSVTARHLNRLMPPARNNKLLALLDIHKKKQCSNLRDRIFSLLALCDDAAELKVDYETSDYELAKYVLRSCTTTLCFCAVAAVASSLELHDEAGDPRTSTNIKDHVHYAYMTLPLVASEEKLRHSHSPRALYSGHNNASGDPSPIITINLEDICPRYFSTELKFSFISKDFGYSWGGLDRLRTGEQVSNIRGCSIGLSSDGKLCTIGFSFDALLQITRNNDFYGSRACGSRSRSAVLCVCQDVQNVVDDGTHWSFIEGNKMSSRALR